MTDATAIKGRGKGFGFSVRHIMLTHDAAHPNALETIEAFCEEGVARYRRAASRLSAIYRAEAPFYRETFEEAIAANAECTAIMHHFENLKDHFQDQKIATIIDKSLEEIRLAAFDATRHFLQIQTWFQPQTVSVQTAGAAEAVGLD